MSNAIEEKCPAGRVRVYTSRAAPVKHTLLDGFHTNAKYTYKTWDEVESTTKDSIEPIPNPLKSINTVDNIKQDQSLPDPSFKSEKENEHESLHVVENSQQQLQEQQYQSNINLTKTPVFPPVQSNHPTMSQDCGNDVMLGLQRPEPSHQSARSVYSMQNLLNTDPSPLPAERQREPIINPHLDQVHQAVLSSKELEWPSIRTNNTSNTSEYSPKFYIGKKVRKYFAGYGWYTGEIVSTSSMWDIGNKLLFRVNYTDGDSEDMGIEDLQHCVNEYTRINQYQ